MTFASYLQERGSRLRGVRGSCTVNLSLLLLAASTAFAQESAILKFLPKPADEPWTTMTPKQRFDLYASQTFSPAAAVGAISGAAFSQAINSPKEWGQGWGAYGIRTASGYGRGFVGNTITFGVASIVHDDNRYFRSGEQALGARLGYVLASPYVSRNEAGKRRFSTSLFLGSTGSASIPLLWSPPSWQGWDNVGLSVLIWYGQTAGANLVREFYPTVVQIFHKKKP